MKPLHPEQYEFLRDSNETLRKELAKTKKQLAEKTQLLGYYEMNLVSKKEVTVKKPHERFPACFKPLSELQLSY